VAEQEELLVGVVEAESLTTGRGDDVAGGGVEATTTAAVASVGGGMVGSLPNWRYDGSGYYHPVTRLGWLASPAGLLSSTLVAVAILGVAGDVRWWSPLAQDVLTHLGGTEVN
jgi:hypothetical protein